MKVYVIIQDDEGNLHQGHVSEAQEIIVSKLVKCYPNGNITKDFINDVAVTLAERVDFKKVK